MIWPSSTLVLLDCETQSMQPTCRKSCPAQPKPGGTTKGAASAAGFTLIELMVVLLILVFLASIAAPRVSHYLRRAKTETAKVQVEALAAAVDSFHLDLGRYPSNEEGLRALTDRPAAAPQWDGPYIKKRDSLTDPWGNPYRYQSPGQHGEFDLYTLGSDNRVGGEGDAQDVGNW